MPRPRKDRVEEALSDRLPIDVLPYSNQEFLPGRPTREQQAIMRIASDECDRWARKHGLSRRAFLQTGGAYVACLAAINHVLGGSRFAFADCPDSLDQPFNDVPIDWPNAQGQNLAGEFILDLQTHHVDSGVTFPGEVEGHPERASLWRLDNPATAAFLGFAFEQSQTNASSFPFAACGEPDAIECLGQFHYMKELFLDSSTNVAVLSAVPFRDDGNPLPTWVAASTCETVNGFANIQPDGSGRRMVMHRFCMPNRGSAGSKSDSLHKSGIRPLFLQEELDWMERDAAEWGASQGDPRKFHLRAWKIYTAWGDVPYTSGWWMDDQVGIEFIRHALRLTQLYGVPPIVCVHKGFALPAFDQEKASPRDVGVVAAAFPKMNFLIYHSGYDGDDASGGLAGPLNQGTSAQGPYPRDYFEAGMPRHDGDESVIRSIDRGVDNLIKSLREQGWSARHFAPGGSPGTPMEAGDGAEGAHANVPNVYGELGAVWGSVLCGNKPQNEGSAQAVCGPTGTMEDGTCDPASWLLAKLIYYVGPKRVVWGTDALWGGSPQGLIVALRCFRMAEPAREMYNLPFGLDGDCDDPTRNVLDPNTYDPSMSGWDPALPGDSKAHPERSIRNGILGRNAAGIYQIAPDASLASIGCDDLQQIRDRYLINPMRQNLTRGPRTRREVFAALRRDPWHQGAIRRMNERGFRKV